jgi:hypothetical protein
MVKYDLREQGYAIQEKFAKKFITGIVWAVFTILMIALSGVLLYIGNKAIPVYADNEAQMTFFMHGDIILYMFGFILVVFLHFILKFLLTFKFCHDKYNSVTLKTLEDYKFPVCYCREALKTWQIILIYVVPAVVVYVLMFLISTTMLGNPFREVESGFMTMLFFLSFFLAFDFMLVAHVLFMKIRYNADYIAIDNHVYRMTAYTASYVTIKGKKVRRSIKPENKPEKQMFIKMTTCLNPECENYAQKLEKKTKICPLCDAGTYLSEVLQNVKACVNRSCDNYGHELKQETEVCSLCGLEIKPLALVFNRRLALPAIALAVISTIVFTFIYMYIYNYIGADVVKMDSGTELSVIVIILNVIRNIILVVSVIMGFLSKNTLALIVTAVICFLAFTIGNAYIIAISYW